MPGGHHDLYPIGLGLKKFLYQLGTIIILRKMGEEKMAHKIWPASQEKLHRLLIGEMAQSAPDPVLQVPWITAFLQHGLIIIRFEEGGVTVAEMVGE